MTNSNSLQKPAESEINKFVVAPPTALHKMTSKAIGLGYQAFIDGGWTVKELIKHGFMEVQ